jgi:hypothetical protein
VNPRVQVIRVGGLPQKADTRLLSPCGRGRKIMVLVRERQVIDFSGEGEVSGAETGPLSWNFSILADAKMLKFAFSPTRVERVRAATSHED